MDQSHDINLINHFCSWTEPYISFLDFYTCASVEICESDSELTVWLINNNFTCSKNQLLYVKCKKISSHKWKCKKLGCYWCCRPLVVHHRCQKFNKFSMTFFYPKWSLPWKCCESIQGVDCIFSTQYLDLHHLSYHPFISCILCIAYYASHTLHCIVYSLCRYCKKYTVHTMHCIVCIVVINHCIRIVSDHQSLQYWGCNVYSELWPVCSMQCTVYTYSVHPVLRFSSSVFLGIYHVHSDALHHATCCQEISHSSAVAKILTQIRTLGCNLAAK